MFCESGEGKVKVSGSGFRVQGSKVAA